ncbi:MAG TPA: 4-hydroxy-tetrahydrodipicolinate reductase [Chthoniobacterales bacterium]
MKLLVHGADGRLGSLIVGLAERETDVKVTKGGRKADLETLLPACDVAIDVSRPAGTIALVKAAAVTATPLVIGTTGFSAVEQCLLDEQAARLPVLLAPNFSLGVNLLFWLVQKAAGLLGPDYRVEIVEMHHELKRDAPSGTARRLGEAVAAARGQNYEQVVRHGRAGPDGARTADEVGMHSLRGGDIAGEHTVFLIGQGERLELTHRAANRELFARGALRAARWLQGKPPGRYGMGDVLGLPPAA